jgi:hypothetical protein
MPQFQATVRLFDIAEADGPGARRVLEERLRNAGFGRWQVTQLGLQAEVATVPARVARRRIRTDASYAGGGLLLVAVAAWALWFLWLLAG